MKNFNYKWSVHHLTGLLTLALLIIFFGTKGHASTVQKIKCETAFGEKVFTVGEQTIAFHSKQRGRSISSVMEATTKKTFSGFRKTLYVDGNKHLIHIADLNNMNSEDDFMAITSPKGHKMTYPLSCTQSL